MHSNLRTAEDIYGSTQKDKKNKKEWTKNNGKTKKRVKKGTEYEAEKNGRTLEEKREKTQAEHKVEKKIFVER